MRALRSRCEKRGDKTVRATQKASHQINQSWGSVPKQMGGIVGAYSSISAMMGKQLQPAISNVSIEFGELLKGADKLNAEFIEGPALPSFQTGTSFVPRDLLVRLQEGEAVSPRRANPFRGGGSITQNFHFTNTSRGKVDPAVVASIFAQRVRSAARGQV